MLSRIERNYLLANKASTNELWSTFKETCLNAIILLFYYTAHLFTAHFFSKHNIKLAILPPVE